MDNLKELLDKEIQSEFEILDGTEFGSDAYKVGVEGLTKLIDRAIELEKVENDVHEKSENREHELKKLELDNKIKREQLEENRKDQLYKNGITIASVVLPAMITIWGTIKTLKFEEEGTVTTIIGRGFINKLIPKK